MVSGYRFAPAKTVFSTAAARSRSGAFEAAFPAPFSTAPNLEKMAF
jgi:hypothetical protein